MKPSLIPHHQHLHSLYPQLPPFANDPQQSPLIQCYDLLLKRFQGLYSQPPKYFIRSPATFLALGSTEQIYGMSTVSMCGLQNVVVAVAGNAGKRVRVNHYQGAVYGERVYEGDGGKWKNQDKGDEYGTMIMGCLKVYAAMFNLEALQGVDLLVYDDFVQDTHLHWRQALCLGVAVALHSVHTSKQQVSNLREQFCTKFLEKVRNLTQLVTPISFSILSGYNKLAVTHPHQPAGQKTSLLPFPEQCEMVLAHSMTPMPKKLVQGKRENLRRCEVQIGIEIIKNEIGATNNIGSLGQLRQYLNCSTSELLETVHECVPQEDLTAERIEQITEKSLIEILKLVPYANNVIDQNAVFRPYKRIKFYLEEQLLVEQLSESNLLDSLAKSYENSVQLLGAGSQQLSEMAGLVRPLAPLHKIVGNGWGGYLLVLAPRQHAQAVVETLVQQFYLHPDNRVLLSDDVEQYIKVVGRPANGLAVLDPLSEIWY